MFSCFNILTYFSLPLLSFSKISLHRFEQCSAAVRYRNANDRIDIYLQLNEDLVFGLVVISLLEYSTSSYFDHHRHALRQFEKKSLSRAAARWMQKAKNIEEGAVQQKVVNAIVNALHFCNVEEILPTAATGSRQILPRISTSSITPPDLTTSEITTPSYNNSIVPTIASHHSFPDNLIKSLCNLITRADSGNNKEHEMRKYLKSMSPRPLPKNFRFEAERYVRYRNSKDEINLTLKLNEELVYGLVIAALLERPDLSQFTSITSESLVKLDLHPFTVVSDKFREKSEHLAKETQDRVSRAISLTGILIAQSKASGEDPSEAGIKTASPHEDNTCNSTCPSTSVADSYCIDRVTSTPITSLVPRSPFKLNQAAAPNSPGSNSSDQINSLTLSARLSDMPLGSSSASFSADELALILAQPMEPFMMQQQQMQQV